MNSALKPVLTPPTSQNPPVTSQLNKQMHSQNPPNTYVQPSTHLPPSLANLPHTNSTIAHSHPAHQTNHYSLNVPNAPQHYGSNVPSSIPASNHPVPNQPATQSYPNKNPPFAGGYQPNLGHPPNNPLPPVSQTLPASQLPAHPAEVAEKPQSNGTTEAKSPAKLESQNHLQVAKPQSPEPSPPSPNVPKKEESTIVPEKSEESTNVVEDEKKITEVESKKDDNLVVTETKSLDGSPTEPETKNEKTPIEDEEPSSSEATEVNTEVEDQPADDDEEEDDEPEEETTSSKPKETEKKTTPVAKTTPRTPTRKSKTPKSDMESPKTSKSENKLFGIQKSANLIAKTKRTRMRTQHYQSPLPEIEIITKISSSTPRSKSNDDKLIVFYKNEFLAVRNSEGSFYVCQAVQNIYRSSPRIRIRWLSQDKNEKSGEVYIPDFYDNTDFDCILTNINLSRVDKGRFRLPPAEKERTDSILKRSLAVEKGEVTSPSLTEEHPDGIDLSLYKEESQLQKRKTPKRKASSALRGSSARRNAKSPDQPKVRKVVAKSTKKVAVPKQSLSAQVKKASQPVPDVKKLTSSSRSDRAKRRSENQNHNKVSPVVDHKKAKVLAKVVRKVIASPPKTTAKSTKVVKAKVKKPPPKAATRKTKRSSRK